MVDMCDTYFTLPSNFSKFPHYSFCFCMVEWNKDVFIYSQKLIGIRDLRTYYYQDYHSYQYCVDKWEWNHLEENNVSCTLKNVIQEKRIGDTIFLISSYMAYDDSKLCISSNESYTSRMIYDIRRDYGEKTKAL